MICRLWHEASWKKMNLIRFYQLLSLPTQSCSNNRFLFYILLVPGRIYNFIIFKVRYIISLWYFVLNSIYFYPFITSIYCDCNSFANHSKRRFSQLLAINCSHNLLTSSSFKSLCSFQCVNLISKICSASSCYLNSLTFLAFVLYSHNYWSVLSVRMWIRSDPKLVSGLGSGYGSGKKSLRIRAAPDPNWIWSKSLPKNW